MRKFTSLAVLVCLLMNACITASPENYFDIAVLNTNMMHGFASDGLQRELESPSVKLVAGTKDQTEPMKRKEIIDSKIQFLEPNLEKIKKLKQTDDNRDMLQASLALYEYVLPVYRNEYQQLAKQYDDGASSEQIQALQQSIQDKYYPQFERLFNNLTAAAKPYAERHHIQVNWDVSTSPQ
jgi:Fe2+ transport system protein B